MKIWDSVYIWLELPLYVTYLFYRYASGEVKGKYGYYDDTGSLREVEYGATPKGGFEPTGTGLVNPAQTAQVTVQQVPQAAAPQQETVDLNGRRASVVRRPRPEGSDRRVDVAVRRNQVMLVVLRYVTIA